MLALMEGWNESVEFRIFLCNKNMYELCSRYLSGVRERVSLVPFLRHISNEFVVNSVAIKQITAGHSPDFSIWGEAEEDMIG